MSSPDKARLKQVSQAIKLAQREYLAAVALAEQRGALRNDEVVALRRFLKRVGRNRGDLSLMEENLRELKRRTGTLTGRRRVPVANDPLNPPADPAGPGHSIPQSLGERGQKRLADRWRVVSAMLGGASARQAIQQTGVDTNPRSARRWLTLYREEGVYGLMDRRMHNGPDQGVMTSHVRELLAALLFERPAAPLAALHRDLRKQVGERAPSYESVKQLLASWPRTDRIMRTGQADLFEQKGAIRLQTERTTAGNQRWQADGKELDIWVRVPTRDGWKAARAWVVAAIDSHTRAVAGLEFRLGGIQAADVQCMLANAICEDAGSTGVHGIPEVFQTDRGTEFTADSVLLALAAFNIRHDLDPPRYPQRKGKIERWFRTLNQQCTSSLPGQISQGRSIESGHKRLESLLTLPEAEKAIRSWVREDYHQQVHRETNRRPYEHWLETPVRLPHADDRMVAFFQWAGPRTVQTTGVQVTFEGKPYRYLSPALQPHVGRRVEVAYLPENPHMVWVFETGRKTLIAPAFDPRKEGFPFEQEGVLKERRTYKRNLKARTLGYTREAHPIVNERVVGATISAFEAVEAAPPVPRPVSEDEILLEAYRSTMRSPKLDSSVED